MFVLLGIEVAGADTSTIKLSLGANLEHNADWQAASYFVDAMKSARAWGSVAAPWSENAPGMDGQLVMLES